MEDRHCSVGRWRHFLSLSFTSVATWGTTALLCVARKGKISSIRDMLARAKEYNRNASKSNHARSLNIVSVNEGWWSMWLFWNALLMYVAYGSVSMVSNASFVGFVMRRPLMLGSSAAVGSERWGKLVLIQNSANTQDFVMGTLLVGGVTTENHIVFSVRKPVFFSLLVSVHISHSRFYLGLPSLFPSILFSRVLLFFFLKNRRDLRTSPCIFQVSINFSWSRPSFFLFWYFASVLFCVFVRRLSAQAYFRLLSSLLQSPPVK